MFASYVFVYLWCRKQNHSSRYFVFYVLIRCQKLTPGSDISSKRNFCVVEINKLPRFAIIFLITDAKLCLFSPENYLIKIGNEFKLSCTRNNFSHLLPHDSATITITTHHKKQARRISREKEKAHGSFRHRKGKERVSERDTNRVHLKIKWLREENRVIFLFIHTTQQNFCVK